MAYWEIIVNRSRIINGIRFCDYRSSNIDSLVIYEMEKTSSFTTVRRNIIEQNYNLWKRTQNEDSENMK